MRETMNRKSILTLWIVALSALLIVVACGGDDDDGNDNGDGTPTPGASASTDGTPEGRTPAPTAVEGSDDITDLSAAYLAGVDGKTTYHYVSNFGQHPDGTLIRYRLGESDRQDWISAPEGIEGTTTIIRTSGDDYMCNSSAFFGSCQVSDEATFAGIDAIFAPISDVPRALVAGLNDAVITDLPSATYAGVETTCFQLDIPHRIGEGPTGTETATLCFADDGRLLYEKRNIMFEDPSFPGAELTFEAQEIGEPVEGDFEPTFPT